MFKRKIASDEDCELNNDNIKVDSKQLSTFPNTKEIEFDFDVL